MASNSPSKAWWETRIGRLTLIAGTMGLFLLVFWLTMRSRDMVVQASSSLVVAEQFLSLGEVWEGVDSTCLVPVENTSSKEVIVTEFLSSCACLRVEPTSARIPPGGKINLSLTLNPGAGPPPPVDGVNDLCVSVIPVLANQISPPQGWTFGAKVRKLATFSPARVELWTDLRKGGPDIHRIINIVLHVPATTIVATSSSPFLLSTNLTKRGPGTYELDLIIPERSPSGPFEHTVQLKIADDAGHEKSGPKLVVTGLVREDVEALPGQVSLGAASLGATLSEYVLLQSRAGEHIRLLGIDNPCPDATVVHTNSGEDGVSFQLVQRVSQLGQQSYVLSCRLESVESPHRAIIVPVTVQYYGFSPRPEES